MIVINNQDDDDDDDDINNTKNINNGNNILILKGCETLNAAQCGALDQNLLPDITFLQLDNRQRGSHEEALFAKATPSR